MNTMLYSQQERIAFESITNDDDLSQGTVKCIFQDSKGFMWFGTMDGLNKYDGKEFIVYLNNPKDSSSLPNNQILKIAEDKHGFLWIGAYGSSLIKMDPYKEVFSRIELIDNKGVNLDNLIITSLCFQDENTLWIGTRANGLIKYKLDDNSFEWIHNDPNASKTILSNNVADILIDSAGLIFIAFNDTNGLAIFEEAQNSFEYYRPEPISPGHNTLFTFEDIEMADDGNLWIADFGYGLYHFDVEKKKFTNFRTREFERPVMEADFIRDIIVDDSIIWCATEGWGLCKYNLLRNESTYYYADKNNKKSISMSGLLSLYKDKSGMLWIGTNGSGINQLSNTHKNFITYNKDFLENIDLHRFSVRGILKDKDSIWITSYGGLLIHDLKTNKVDFFSNLFNNYAIAEDPDDKNHLFLGNEGGGISRIHKKSLKVSHLPYSRNPGEKSFLGDQFFVLKNYGDYLYAGSNIGLSKYNRITKEVEYFIHDPQNPSSINRGFIKAFFKDSKGNYWVGTDVGGLGKFDGNTNSFKRYVANLKVKESLSNNYITAISEDSKGNIWICTHGGLNKYIPETESFELISLTDGLPNNVIYACLEDELGNFWLSTNKGLSRFNPQSMTCLNFDVDDGIQGNEFNTAAYYAADDGELFFGGTNGFTRFYPDEIRENKYVPSVVLTYLDIKNGKEDSKRVISGLEEIRLDYDDAIFEIGFAALSYYLSDKNRYKYKISGLDNQSDNWIDLGTENKISFIGLDPGEYILIIKGSNNDGVWNEESLETRILIIPSWYNSLWFKVLLIALVVILVGLFFYVRMNIIRHQKIKLQNLVDEKTHELRELNETKDRFFSIIGHDLKTPLQGILGFSGFLKDDYDSFSEWERRQFINDIYTSADVMARLTENLLYWASTQRSEVKISKEKFSINEIIQDACEMNTVNAQKKNISVKIDKTNDFDVWADKNMIKTVMRNLLANAIKFTFPEGEINIQAKRIKDFIEVAVIDNGIGISKEDIQLLFNLNTKFKTEGTAKEKGTGLGLIICSEFISHNGGKIWVESELGKGSSFIFALPVYS